MSIAQNRLSHPFGLDPQQALEAFAYYLSPEARRELNNLVMREAMREVHAMQQRSPSRVQPCSDSQPVLETIG